MYRKFFIIGACFATLLLNTPAQVFADDVAIAAKLSKKSKKVYGETEFIKLFSHKSRQQVSEVLGKPADVAQASKPSNAETSVARLGQSMDQTKVDHVEMWYYKNLVRYDPKHVYNKIELTFVNDICQNIAYFNDKK